MESRKIVHVFSGGLDSTVMLFDLISQGHDVSCINFNYGSKHNEKENAAAQKICKSYNIPLKFVKMDFINELFESALLSSGEEIPEGHYENESMKKTVVPFRNGVMLSIAGGYAESIDAEYVTAAVHSGDHAIYPDCRPEFVLYMNKALQAGTYKKIHFWAPYLKKDKKEIVELGSLCQAPMHLTWTCYKGKKLACGKCGSCVERLEAFKLAGINDPIKYETKETTNGNVGN